MMEFYIVTIVCFAAASQAAPQKRLTGGIDVTVNQFQWVGSLQQNVCGKWTHICGCAVLFDVVDTAAHCFPRSANIEDYRVVYGTNDLMNTSATIIPIQSITRHPQFLPENGPGFGFDFASLGITAQVSGISTGGPIRSAGKKCKVYGWSRLSGSSEPSILHSRSVRTVRRQKCKATVLSLGATISERDTCVDAEVITEGDGGSPLVCGNEIIGVASWSAAGVTIFTAGDNYAR